jgi:hypothetical protein
VGGGKVINKNYQHIEEEQLSKTAILNAGAACSNEEILEVLPNPMTMVLRIHEGGYVSYRTVNLLDSKKFVYRPLE